MGRLVFSSEPINGGGRSTGTSMCNGRKEVLSLKSSLYVRAKGSNLSCPTGGDFGRFDFAASDLLEADPAVEQDIEDEEVASGFDERFGGDSLSSSAVASAFEGWSFKTARKSRGKSVVSLIHRETLFTFDSVRYSALALASMCPAPIAFHTSMLR